MPAARRGVWLHATEPGLEPGLRVLATALAEQPENLRIQVTGGPGAPGPGDELRNLDAAFDHFPAALLVLAGSALPVPMIERARARGVALMLVEAGNPVPAGGWRLLRGSARGLLTKFAAIHAQGTASAAAIARQVKGAVPVLATGRLAQHGPVRGCNEVELGALRAAIGARPVWLAQDVPASEVAAVLQAHAHALRRAHRLMLILQPRDPGDAPMIAESADAAGFVRARRSTEEEIDETTQLYIADAGDDAGLFLRLAPVCYLGGSLTRGAGVSSPVVPAALGSALIFGPQAGRGEQDFLDRLRQSGGGRQIDSEAELGPAVSALLAPEAGADSALRAWTLATEGADATYTVARAICDHLALNRGRG